MHIEIKRYLFNGTIYKIGTTLVIDNQSMEKTFGKIISIRKENEEIVFELEVYKPNLVNS